MGATQYRPLSELPSQLFVGELYRRPRSGVVRNSNSYNYSRHQLLTETPVSFSLPRLLFGNRLASGISSSSATSANWSVVIGTQRFSKLSVGLQQQVTIALYRPLLETVRFFGWHIADLEKFEELKAMFDSIDTDKGGC